MSLSDEKTIDLAFEEISNLSRMRGSDMDRGQWCRLKVARAYVDLFNSTGKPAETISGEYAKLVTDLRWTWKACGEAEVLQHLPVGTRMALHLGAEAIEKLQRERDNLATLCREGSEVIREYEEAEELKRKMEAR